MQTVSGVNFISDNSTPEVYMGVINFGASDIILPNGYGAQTMQISDAVTSQVVTKASDKVVRIQSFTVSTNYITTVSKNDAVPDDIFIEACNGISSSLLGVSVNSVSSCKVEAGKFAKADIPIKDDGTNTVHAYYTMPAKDDKLYILLIQDNKNSEQDDAIAVVKNGFFLRTAYEE